MKQHLALTVVSSLLLVACASTPSHPQDPMEPMNRAIYQFNDKADRYVMKPVAEGYRFITPQPVRTGVGNFFNNLDDVYNMANHGLQLEGRKSLTDFLRVAFNSTFGLFGLIDIATPMGLKREPTGLGDTMAHYGWKSSSYLVLPLLGPSTVRDGLGTAAHLTVADPQNLVFHVERDANAASAINAVSKREQLLGLEGTLQQAALDPYVYMRDAWLQYRNKQVGYQPVAAPGGEPTLEDENIDDLVAPEAAAPETGASAPLAQLPASAAQ